MYSEAGREETIRGAGGAGALHVDRVVEDEASGTLRIDVTYSGYAPRRAEFAVSYRPWAGGPSELPKVATRAVDLPATTGATHTVDIEVPPGARYRATECWYTCPHHGVEHMVEGETGHWFKFISARHDRTRGVVVIECRYWVHDRDAKAEFHVIFDPVE